MKFAPARKDGKARTGLASCRFVPQGLRVLNLAARRLGISRAELMRNAIDRYVSALPFFEEIRKEARAFDTSATQAAIIPMLEKRK